MSKAEETAPKQQKKKVIGTPFKPGQSGNPNGRPKGSSSLPDAVRRAGLKQFNKDRDRVEHLAEVIWALALSGEKWACDFVADRGWGKAPQTITQKNINIDHGVWDEESETAEEFLSRELSKKQ